MDHVVEDPDLLLAVGDVAPAEAGRRVEVRLLLARGERRLERAQRAADQPDGVMQVDDLHGRALAVLRVDEARAEADDVAVDGRALLLQVDVDQVLARLDPHRAELVVEDLRPRRRPGIADGDVDLRGAERRRGGVGASLTGELGVGAAGEQRAEPEHRQGNRGKGAA